MQSRDWMMRFAGVGTRLIFLLTVLSSVYAREEEVLITAKRYETGEMRTPAFTTVITAEELEKTGARSLVEALRIASGLTYVGWGPMGTSHGGMNSELPIRGIRHGELILINGVPINNPSAGGYDLNCIPVSAIERVEIVKGASSVLYGSAALTGVINIITKKQEELKGKVSVEGGTESYTRDNFSFGNDKIFGSLSYLHLGKQTEISNNYSSEYSYDSKPLNEYSLFLSVNPLENISFNYLGSMEEGGFVREPWEGSSTSRQESDQDIKKHFANFEFRKNKFTANSYYYWDDLKCEYDDGRSKSTIRAYRYGLNPQYHGDLGEKFDFLAGGDYQFDHVDTSSYGIHKKHNYSFYSTFAYKPVEHVSFDVGGRQQWINQPDAEDYSEFCPQFQANYLFTPDFSFYANVGRAFRAPDFLELYYEGDWLVGNPSLKSESGWTYEVGPKYSNPSLAAKFALFSMRYKDKIQVDYSQDPMTYYNANRFYSEGLEWDIESYLWDCWTIGLAGYWADPIVEDTEGEEEQGGARFQLSPSIEFDNDSFKAKATLLMIQDREMELDDFFSVNIAASYKIGAGEITLSISNLLDEKNVTAGNMTSTASSQYEHYDMGRIISLGYKTDF